MVNFFKDLIGNFRRNVAHSRLLVFGVVMAVLLVIIVQRLFVLQVVNGADYLNNYTMSIEKEITTEGIRGNIYDKNGLLLAYNELSYTITIEDSGSYASTSEKNEQLNDEISRLIDMIEANGDSIVSSLNLYMDPNGELSFLVEGNSLQSFRRDVYGRSSISELVYNTKLGYDEARATTEQMFDYLTDEFGVDTEFYGRYRAYQIMMIRYELSLNSYQKYLSTDVAVDVSDETVAMVEEHIFELEGVGVSESTKRVYNYPEYFSHIIGYTGRISSEEYEKLSAEDDSYTMNDMVGKSGIEQVMEEELQGTKGTQTVYVDNVGHVLEVKETTDPVVGNDVYLSIDATLQMAVYDLLEQELAGIIYANIVNAKYVEEDDLNIPIYDVYSTLVENNVIDITLFPEAADTSYQHVAYQAYLGYRDTVYTSLERTMNGDTAFEDLSAEMQEYVTYAVTYLQNTGVFDTTDVSISDSTYSTWKNGGISVREYLEYAIDTGWIEMNSFEMEEKYANTGETYEALVAYVIEQLKSSTAFDRLIYKYLIYQDKINPNALCLILFEQGILQENYSSYRALETGTESAYNFLKDKIKNLEITPAQLALDPCTGSCVLMDPNTGELLACVTYPGYDTNRLANSMDVAYYNSLLIDESLPMYNNATQQATAPGSTFKMVMAAAALTEGVINENTVIYDSGSFAELDYDLHCWIYPGKHEEETVVTAIRDSCNTFFCELGYRLSLEGDDVFNENVGLEYIQEYADLFGFGEKTGLEISEGTTNIATEYPVSASIGQSNHRFTTVQLCRYAAALANRGTVYHLTLLDHVENSAGKSIETFEPEVRNIITEVSDSTWSLMQTGMEEVITTHSQFDDLNVTMAGKTGTAQENETRPNHALFVGYAPADEPEIAIATRIAYGYTSRNACDFAATVMQYYFGEVSSEELLTGQAEDVQVSENQFVD